MSTFDVIVHTDGACSGNAGNERANRLAQAEAQRAKSKM
jgi:hypothetical protein